MGYPPQTLADSNPSIAFSSVGEMAAFRPPNFRVFSIVGETGSGYQWTPGDTSTANGVDIVAQSNTGGVAGRWLRKWIGGSTGTTGSMLFFETVADAQAAPGPAVKTFAWIGETDAPYEFIPADATAINAWTVVGNTGGTNGRWLIKSDRISIASQGGAVDDWPRLNLAMIACAYKVTIVLRAGAWLCSTTGEVPSGTHLTTEGAGVVITSNMSTGGFTNFVFKRFASLAATGTLSAAPTVGSTTVSIATTSPAVGDWIWIGQGTNTPFIAQQFEVKTVAGAGPFTVTIDRPVRFQFFNGDPARVQTAQVRDIILDGNGATIKGTGDAAFKMLGAYRTHVRDWLITTDAAGGIFTNGCTFDVASLDSTCEDIDVDCTRAVTPTSQAMYFESVERFTCRKCTADTAGYAIAWWDCVDSFQEDCSGSKNTTAGTIFTGNGGDSPFVGCTNVTVKGGNFDNCPNIGVAWIGSVDCRTIGVECDDNFTGFSIDNTSLRARITDCGTKRNTTYGIYVQGIDASIDGQSSVSDAISIITFVPVNIDRLTALNYASRALYVDVTTPNGSIITVDGGRLSSTISGSVAVDVFAAARVTLDRVRVVNAAVDASQNAIVGRNAVASVITLRDVIGAESSASGGYLGQAGATLRSYGSTSLIMTVPITINGAGFYNRGAIVSGGANVAQAVPFPDLKLDEIPKITRVVDGGAPGIGPVVLRTPGTGWTEKYAAGDTSTYYHEV